MVEVGEYYLLVDTLSIVLILPLYEDYLDPIFLLVYMHPMHH